MEDEEEEEEGGREEGGGDDGVSERRERWTWRGMDRAPGV